MIVQNTSSAYDLSLYGTAAPREKQRPELVVKRSPKRALSPAFGPQALCAFAIVVTMVCLVIYNQVRLNEINEELGELTQELKVLETEHVNLASILESTVSLRTVAEMAQEMGMNRLDKYQIEYVNLYQDDSLVVARQPENNSAGGQVKLAILSLVNSFQEYIAGK